MRFEQQGPVLTVAEIARVESRIGLRLPASLRRLYLIANGGKPVPYVYEDDQLDTVVARFLPLTSLDGRRTAVDVYTSLVSDKKLVPASYFPFAVDGGGDYFFADCADGGVYFFRSDTASDEHIVALHVDVASFFSRLKDE